MELRKLEDMILNDDESQLLDFKMYDYDFSDEKKKIDFIKDVISMANTPRKPDEPGYIILGVEHILGGPNNIVGIPIPKDDVQYQNILQCKLIDGIPVIRVSTLKICEKNVVCIAICVDTQNRMPYTCKDNVKNQILAERIYYRVGSSNAIATNRASSQIYDWFAHHIMPNPLPIANSAGWNSLTERLLKLRNRQNILLVLPSDIYQLGTRLAPLARLLSPYAVIDLDPESDKDGAFSYMHDSLNEISQVHMAQPQDTLNFSSRSTVWYFAYGLDAKTREQSNDIKEWIRASDQIFRIFRNIESNTLPHMLTVVMLVAGTSLQRSEEEMLVRLASQEHASVFVIAESTFRVERTSLRELSDKVFFLNVGIGETIDSLQYAIEPQNSAVDIRTLPDVNGMPKAILADEQVWYGEYIDFCYRETTEGNDSPELFRKGGTPSWYDFYRNFDCQRDVPRKFITHIENSLQRRRRDRFNIYHSPGSGGTTLAKRILWDLHESYPVGELLTCTPANNVAACLGAITQKTGNSLLLMVESSRFTTDEINTLFEHIRAEQIPVVFLQVSRLLGSYTQEKDHSLWLPVELSKREATLMAEVYRESMPNRQHAINKVLQNKQEWQCISFGLAAYSGDYQGIDRYVETRMQHLTPMQRQILMSYALVYFYGQQSLSPLYFSKLLERPDNQINLESIFSMEARDTIDLLLEENNGEYRVMHQLIAEKILQLGLGDATGTHDWKLRLGEFAQEFAAILALNEESHDAKRILHRLFIDRVSRTEDPAHKTPNIESMGGPAPYSMLVCDIPNPSTQLLLFDELSKLFPNDAHIHAHKARINSHHGKFEEAKDAIEKALSLNDHDDVICHIYGTILRNKIRDLLNQGYTTDVNWNKIKQFTDEALGYFAKSRDLDPNKEHAYITEIYLCCEIIESAKKIFKCNLVGLLQQKLHGSFFVRVLQLANERLEGIRNLQVGSSLPSNHAEQCKAKLARVQEEYSRALECYNNLLSRADIPKPPLRRLIAYTYGQRDNLHPNPFNPATALTVYHLMETNIKEEHNYDKNMPLWLNAARSLTQPPSIERVLSYIACWKGDTPRSIPALFYYATFVSLQVINGATGLLNEARSALEFCKQAARVHQWRTFSREWLADDSGIKGIIPHAMVGQWNDNFEFFNEYAKLRQMGGRVTHITDNGKGKITLDCGLEAFFIPSRFNVVQGRDENKSIRFYLAFSYDGLRAWQLPTSDAK